MSLTLDVGAFDNFARVDINKLTLTLFSPATGKNALDIAMNGDVELKPSMNGKIKISKFRFIKDPLLDMLPASFKKSLAGVPLTKPLDMTLGVAFSMGKSIIKAGLDILIKVPDFDVNDLAITADVIQDNKAKRVTLNGFHVGSRERNLSIDAKGTVDLKTPPMSDSDLALSIKLDMPKVKKIYGDMMIGGLVDISAKVKGDLKKGKAFGAIKIEKFNLKNEKSKLAVEDMNMNFPFEYYFTPRYKGESRITMDKSSVIDNENFKEKENFSIRSVKAKHPSRDIQFEFVKDFAATMFFRDNTFELAKLRAYVLDGSLYGRDILFNLADMKPANMEYRLVLDVTNVDIGKLDNPDPAAKQRDAELSLNANFVGKGLEFKKEFTPRGYINIYKIGEKFANKLMKGLSSTKGESKLGIAQPIVDNTMTVKGFNFNLDKGLVYTTVSFDRKIIGWLTIGIDKNKIEFDRMAIQEYVRNIMSGGE
jgi:hypothetical protein